MESTGENTAAPRRPLEPHPTALAIGKQILRNRFEATHKDINAMIAAVREQGLPVEISYFGANSADAKLVILEMADRNLKDAPLSRIQQRIARHAKSSGISMANTIAKFDPGRLGGSGAAGP